MKIGSLLSLDFLVSKALNPHYQLWVGGGQESPTFRGEGCQGNRLSNQVQRQLQLAHLTLSASPFVGST